MSSILVKRPVAFRVQRANDDGLTLSKTEFRYFTDEAEARRESDALCADYQGLYVRDGTPITEETQQLVARIKRSSKYYHQRPDGEWFAVRLSRRYPVVSGNNNAYELSDVVFGVRLVDGSVLNLAGGN